MIEFKTVNDIISTTKIRIGRNCVIGGHGVSDGRVSVNTPVGLVVCIATPAGSSGGGMVRPHTKMSFEINGQKITKKELTEKLRATV
jgi:hypothetical protein